MREVLHRGKNWYSAMGILFLIVGSVSILEASLVWGLEFVVDFLLSPEVNREKVSTGMIGFGIFLISVGFRKKSYDKV